MTFFTELLAVTIATDETDGFTRYAESADRYGIKHKVMNAHVYKLFSKKGEHLIYKTTS